MGRTANVWERVKEAEEIIKKLCEKHPDVLWAVKPENIVVMAIVSKEKSEKNNVLARIRLIKGSERAVLIDNGIPVRHIIEIYGSDWSEWKEKKRQWVLLHELLHVHAEIEKMVKHDLECFKILVKTGGVNWAVSDEKDLPNLLTDDVKFDLALRPGMDEYADDGKPDEISDVLDEIEKEKAGKAGKEDKKE